MNNPSRTAVALSAAILLLAVGAGLGVPAGADPAKGDTLEQGFANPPSTARPRVWWHWMNGNITKDGIAKDLDWMRAIGIGGVQVFDANLATPQIVPNRLVYMTPEWKDAFRFAASKASENGLEMAIAASPGWSETGGPWVKPEDGVKKLVWSEMSLMGGRRFTGRLPAPPSVAGPFQDIPAEQDAVAAATGEKQFEVPAFYRDVAVLAYPLHSQINLPGPSSISAGDMPLDIAALTDASLTTAVPVGRGTRDTPTVITVEYDQPQLVQSLTFYAPGGAEKFGAPNYLPRLEAELTNNSWSKVADLALTPVPTTINFIPVKARRFRVILAVNPNGGLSGFTPAVGADLRPLMALRAPKAQLPVAQLSFSGEVRVNQFEAKSGFATVLDYADLAASGGPGIGIAPGSVINLTKRLKPDGTLDWTPPKGKWRVVRLGWSLTGKTNHPAPLEATGLEVDKLDGRAVRNYLEGYLAMYRGAVGDDLIGKRGITALLTDSTEVGAFNWTPQMVEQFKRLRGYDPTPWLPVLTGVMIGTPAQSDAFLYDYRQTLAELHSSEHYGTVAAFAHENGLKVYGEALEDRRPSLGDDMAMRRHADFPMAALWTWQHGEKPRPTLLGDMKGASSVAHLYGQNIAAAESMTSALQYWAHSPADLRRVIDLEFANGINLPIIHSSVHQPVDDKQPGLSLLIFGQFFNRHETWAGMAKSWIDYIARNSFMLQQGRNHADVAYFYGEDTALTALYANGPLTDVPVGYAYDFINADALLNLIRVDGNELTAPSGARYRVLYLGGKSDRMTLPVLRRIADLAAAGATVVGTAPSGSPALADDPLEYAALVKRLWTGQPITKVGRGRMVASNSAEEALRQLGIAPDFDYGKQAPDSEILFVHRKLAAGDIYFINNRRDRAEFVEARFRVNGFEPELWRADTGTSEPVSYRIENGVTVVPLEMNPEDSFFVVFRKPTSATSATVERTAYKTIATMDDNWVVSFEPGRGAPDTLKLGKLTSLSQRPEPEVKYFSGVSTYRNSFTIPPNGQEATPIWIDLGAIGDVAEVRINGRPVGTVWHAPYRLEIGSILKPGTNQIEVRVANLWVNRLIGDAQPGASKVAVTTLPTYTAGAPLRPSGLLGPVRFLRPKTANER